MKKTTKLMNLFNGGKIFNIVGGEGALMAKIIERAGYECAYIGGGGTSRVIYGMPDVGLISRTEMVYNAGIMANAIDIPLIADADHGYGGPVAVRRTVHEFIHAGVAGIHIEDQPVNKRSGHLKGKEVIPLSEMLGKIRAAVAAKDEIDPDFVIIARSDIRGVAGGSLDELITRLKAFKEAGADVLYAEMLLTREEIATVRAEVEGPLMGTLIFINPPPSTEELQKLGYAAAFLVPNLITPMLQAAWEYAHDYRDRGVAAQLEWQNRKWNYEMPSVLDLSGLPEALAWEAKYSDDQSTQKYEGEVGIDPRQDVLPQIR